MGLRDTLKSAVKSGIQAIGDLKKTVIYHDKSDSVYNTVTGTITEDDVLVTIEDAAVVAFKEKEFDGDIVRKGDIKVIFSSSDLPNIIPNLTDTIEIDGHEWNIVQGITPVSDVVYIFHVRPT